MNSKPNPKQSRLSVELSLLILLPVFTVLAGASMIHVASSFGFTALGEPAIVAPAPDDGG